MIKQEEHNIWGKGTEASRTKWRVRGEKEDWRWLTHNRQLYQMNSRCSLGSSRSPQDQQICRTSRDHHLGSPKFMRKRQEGKPFWGKKSQIKSGVEDNLGYISPNKKIQMQLHGCSSARSLHSISSLNPNQSKIFQQPFSSLNNGLQQSREWQAREEPMLRSMRTSTQRYRDSSSQIIFGGQSLQKKNRELRGKAETLQQKLEEIDKKLKMAKDENSFLYQKIEDFNIILEQKNITIAELTNTITQQKQSISGYRNEIARHKVRIEQLEEVVVSLNKTIDESTQSCINVTTETDDCDSQSLEEELLKCRQRVVELSAQLKYNQLQQSIIKKIRHDYQGEVQKNQRLKGLNKRLLLRIESLVSAQKPERGRISNMQRTHSRDSQISFQLSPQKETA